MRKTYRLLLVLVVAATSLSSCSRSNYAFNNNAPAYLGSAQARVAQPTAEVPAALDAALLIANAVAAHHPARAHRATAAHAAVATEATASVVTTESAQLLTKLTRKALKKELKRKAIAAPNEVKETGKSQTTALILCILLGGIGVHQFYLGYTGRGILRIALALTAFLIIPAIINLVLYIMDIIKIANGSLKPRDGDYGQKLGG